MVTVDQSMGGSAEIDYADFATQMVELAIESDDTPGLAEGTAVIEPLRGRGGLANNEVAELLYLETELDVRQLEFANGPDQDVATSTMADGVIGINLPEDPGAAGISDTGVSVDLNPTPETFMFGQSVTDNAYLQQFRTVTGLAFDDDTGSAGGGPGGNFSGDGFHAEKYFRQTHGRGPVLDQTDDITAAYSIDTPDSIVAVQAALNLTMYWDVAETSDAGRRFSVP